MLALLIWAVLRLSGKILAIKRQDEKWLITVNVLGWGVSLGWYVFMDQRYEEKDWKHEFGHCIQSRRWGLFYLLTVGILSAIFNNLQDRLFHKSWDWEKRHKWYYSRYPEKQADKLGGVVREWR